MSDLKIRLYALAGNGTFKYERPLYVENGPETIYIDCSADITVGKGVSIGRGVTILTHEHYHDKNIPIGEAKAGCIPLEIGDDVMLGINVIVCPQVRKIGKGAVIGAGSVLTKDVGEYEIWAGNPARYIRTRE